MSSKNRALTISEDGDDFEESVDDFNFNFNFNFRFRFRQMERGNNPKLKKRKSDFNLLDPLLVCGCDIMTMIFNHLDARSVASSLLVSRKWHALASIDSIWSKKCEELWTGKAHLPRFLQVEGLSKLSAYSLSIKDGKRNRIMKEDLWDHAWVFHFRKDAPEYWRNLDPYWRGTEPPMHRYFHPDGSQTADSDDQVWGGHECCYSIVTSFLGDGNIREHYVRINRWPRMHISRRHDWGWEMSNFLYCYSSVPDAATKDELMCIRNPNFLVGGVNLEQLAGKEHIYLLYGYPSKMAKDTIVCMITTAAAAGCFWSRAWIVNVANEVNNKEKIWVHCKSKDNDIGLKAIGFHESFEWKFCENIISPSTLYFCHFYKGNQEQVFDVFNSTVRDLCADKDKKKDYWTCGWVIKPDGFYIEDHMTDKGDIKIHDWKTRGILDRYNMHV